ncbi:MAG: carboxypeptidase-like regulatory domain-containing protein [Terracidiphilus sp.]
MKRPIAWSANSTKAAGPWLRCFLSVAVAAVAMNATSFAAAQVDCVYPGRVSVPRVQGQVFDPLGTAVPGVVVKLVDQRGSTLQATTDGQGRFRLAAPPGEYSFTAVLPMFQTSQTELSVGEDLAGLVHPRNLYVVLGMAGTFCPWVTTSEKEFRNIINGNKKRSEESTQRNATQK